MKKIIYLVIFLGLVGGGFYLWQNRHDYFFQGEAPYKIYNEDSADNFNNNLDEKAVVSEDLEKSDEEGDQLDEENGEVIKEQSDELLDILQNHCDKQCEDKKEADDYKYCLEICGLNSDNKQSSDCDDLLDSFEKNVCYKNKAIEEKDSGVCDEIQDDLLKENCKDRVIEELFGN